MGIAFPIIQDPSNKIVGGTPSAPTYSDNKKSLFDAVKDFGKGMGWDKSKIYQATAAAIKQAKGNPEGMTFNPQVPDSSQAPNSPFAQNSWNISAAQAAGNYPTPTLPQTGPSGGYKSEPYPSGSATFGPGSTMNDVYTSYNAEWNRLKNNSGFDFYNKELQNAYDRLGDLRTSEDKYIASKTFLKAINSLNNRKYMMRPMLIEKYRRENPELSAVDIEKLIASETGDLDNEINSIQTKWEDQLKEFKTKIDGAKDDITLLTTQVRFAMEDAENGYGSYKDAGNMFLNLDQRDKEWKQQQANWVELLANLEGDQPGITAFLKGNIQPEYLPGSVENVTQPFMNTKYQWGGNSPAGVDCSGLTQYAYRAMYDVTLPRTAAAQFSSDKLDSVGVDEMLPGDLVFFHNPNDRRVQSGELGEGVPTHVGIITENGMVRHSSIDNGGVADNSWEDLYNKWGNSIQYLGAKRVKSQYAPTPAPTTTSTSFPRKGDYGDTEYKGVLNVWLKTQMQNAMNNGEFFPAKQYLTRLADVTNQDVSKVKEQLFKESINADLMNFESAYNNPNNIPPKGLTKAENTVWELYKDYGGIFEIEPLVRQLWGKTGNENDVYADEYGPLEKYAATLRHKDEKDIQNLIDTLNDFKNQYFEAYNIAI